MNIDQYKWYVCMGLNIPLENFSLIGDVTIAGKGLQI